MFAMIFGPLISGFVKMIPGLAGVIGDIIIKREQTEAARQGRQDDNSKELALGWLASVNQTNAIKAANQTPQQVMAGLFFFAMPVGLVFWGALLDGMPFRIPLFMTYPHIIGSWGITIPPEFASDVHMIIQSFFIAAPAIGSVAILAKAFRDRKGEK